MRVYLDPTGKWRVDEYLDGRQERGRFRVFQLGMLRWLGWSPIELADFLVAEGVEQLVPDGIRY